MKRHDIVTDIISTLETVTPANGFHSDFSGRVVSWKSDQIPQGSDLVVQVQDVQAEPGDRFNLPNVQFRLVLNIVVFCAAGNDTAEKIRLAMDDIYRKIISSREALITNYGGIRLSLSGDDMEVFEDDIIAGVGIVGFVLEFIELYTPAVPLPPAPEEE